MNKIILVLIVLLTSLFVVSAAAPQGRCEWDEDCSSGQKCESTYCVEKIMPPPPAPEKILPPPPEMPLKVQEPIAAREGYCGDGIIQSSKEECELPMKSEGDFLCKQIYGRKNYVCDFKCECVSYSFKVPERFCGDGVCTVEKGESPLTCEEDCKAVPKQELKECPTGTERVIETDLVSGEEFAYCVESEIVLPPPPEVPSMKKNVCSGQVFYLKQGEKTTELEFSLPWNPDKASLAKFDESSNEWMTLVESAIFENDKLKLALEKGSYLMNVEKNGVNHQLPVEVVEAEAAASAQMYDVVVHAQNADVVDGQNLVKYFVGLGLKAVLSKATRLKDLPPSELRVFEGGPFANSLVEKAVPGASEQMMNLNTNRIVSANTLVLAGWCQEATIMTNYQLQDEVDDELLALLDDKEPTKEDVMNVLKSKKSEKGKDIACTPDEPEKTEELKKGRQPKKDTRKTKRDFCPREEAELICKNLCDKKYFEGYQPGEVKVSYRLDDEGCTCKFWKRARDDTNEIVNVPSRVDERGRDLEENKISKDDIIEICVDERSGTVDEERIRALSEDTKLKESEHKAKLARERAERLREMRGRDREAYKKALANPNPNARPEFVDALLEKMQCSGELLCKNYCDHEFSECQAGERRRKGYPQNSCAGYDPSMTESEFNPDLMYCSCTFKGPRVNDVTIPPRNIDPNLVYFEGGRLCREQQPEEAAEEEQPAPSGRRASAPGREEAQPEEERSSCTLMDVCEGLCISRLSGTSEYDGYSSVPVGVDSCSCTLANSVSRTSTTKSLTSEEVAPYLTDEELCQGLRRLVRAKLPEINARR